MHRFTQLLIRHRTSILVLLSLLGIGCHLILLLIPGSTDQIADFPLLVLLALGGIPLVLGLAAKAVQGEFGSDLLGGIAIVVAVLLGEYLAGSIIVLMLSGGEALETYALKNASSVLTALANRMPQIAHRVSDAGTVDIPVAQIQPNDQLIVFPHELCPVDGLVIAGQGNMDESYLTGEPFQISKTVGSTVISGAVNGETALTIAATREAKDSRYARIVQVIEQSRENRPRLQRLGDQLGAWYTLLALLVAGLAWGLSGEAIRFLAVLVIATPCPLLIAIPVSIIGAISQCARRAIIIKNPVALEQASLCRTGIFDKTGTLTYGRPALTELLVASGFSRDRILQLTASLERYSKHPLASGILKAARQENLSLLPSDQVSEPPGQGLTGIVDSCRLRITSRKQLEREQHPDYHHLPPPSEGLECLVMLDDQYAATLRFRDPPRKESLRFLHHLGVSHGFERLMIISGDRLSEVRYLAEQVGITEIYADQKPEEKLQRVRAETRQARTLYVGDGINDAPAMLAATVGVGIGQNSDVTAEAAGVVVMDSSLVKVDEFLHISQRLRRIAIQSAVGGMLLSLAGMIVAACGYLHPVQGAVAQEFIDLLAILNALRAAQAPKPVNHLEDHAITETSSR